MSLLDSLKNLFGFTPIQARQPVEPVNSNRPQEPITDIPKPVSQGPPPAGQQRDRLLRFIVEKLRPYQNEPETAPVGLKLCILCTDAEEEAVYRVALWESQPGKFQRELSRQLADNYVKLPNDWRFDYGFYADELPDCTYQNGNLGMIVQNKNQPDSSPLLARIVALTGQTEQVDYILDPAKKTSFCIGRGHSTQTASGRIRTNDIVILNEDDPAYEAKRGAGNSAVSRAHAHIQYDAARRTYSLQVDPGGLPASGNKTKLFHPDERIERADIPGMGYPLQHGDQIELGGEVTLLFELV
ncbi:FHA domain-containing protein [Spirosoma pollinicola]|uniref:FHA domain-containing protein n=1 Tax=Spirosoma pollinicola TaxID=2057025 RepID=A0A2K8YVF2_9BACT|nr:FHA domain-containing protein [Spirosoma pollinicola]AUD01564.1 FHA domain-containing protein [Spirosoma pollinicola]